MPYGIDNLKRLAKTACEFVQDSFTAAADKKFKWTEALMFVNELLEIPGIVRSWDAIKLELADLDAEEKKELYDYICQEFDIPNDHVEAIVEAAIKWMLNLSELIDLWKAAKK